MHVYMCPNCGNPTLERDFGETVFFCNACAQRFLIVGLQSLPAPSFPLFADAVKMVGDDLAAVDADQDGYPEGGDQ